MKYLNIVAMVIGYIVIAAFLFYMLIEIIAGVWAISLIIMPIAIIALIVILIIKAVKKK